MLRHEPKRAAGQPLVGSRQNKMTDWDHIVVSLPARQIDASSRQGRATAVDVSLEPGGC
jgi:hypothetical protein